MRITDEIATQITTLGERDEAMSVFLRPSAWAKLQDENPPHLDAETTPPTIFWVPIRVSEETDMEVQVIAGS
jgi:hypothetical protein